MKAEINNKNKAKFFAQYWEQELVKGTGNIGDNFEFVDYVLSDESLANFSESYLLLKSLSQISDEDARVIAEQNRFNGNYDVFPKVGRDILRRVFELEDSQMCLPTESADYLRSKGYALPWMGLGVKELIEAGWIKLIES